MLDKVITLSINVFFIYPNIQYLHFAVISIEIQFCHQQKAFGPDADVAVC